MAAQEFDLMEMKVKAIRHALDPNVYHTDDNLSTSGDIRLLVQEHEALIEAIREVLQRVKVGQIGTYTAWRDIIEAFMVEAGTPLESHELHELHVH